MDLTQLANLGEFIGGVAVLVTLVYLVIQVRQNTSQVRLGTGAAMIPNIQNAAAPLYDHWDTFDQGLDGDDQPPREGRKFSLLMLRLFHAVQNSHYQQIEGSLGPEWSAVHLNTISSLTHRPGGSRWWKENRAHFPDEFREMVDEIADASG